MMLTQLQTPLPLVTPKGKAWAVAIIDYGPHWDLLWVTFIHDSGECWTFNNNEIRQEKNYTFGLYNQSPIPPAPGHTPLTPNHSEPYKDGEYSARSEDLNIRRPTHNGSHKKLMDSPNIS